MFINALMISRQVVADIPRLHRAMLPCREGRDKMCEVDVSLLVVVAGERQDPRETDAASRPPH